MITDNQARRLQEMNQKEPTLQRTADKVGVDVQTARKYLRSGALPSQCAPERYWRTRQDPFSDVWGWVVQQLELNNHLQAITLFSALQRQYPGRFQDGQLRTLQRRIKNWRATQGPPREVFFAQVHHPGELCQSDFTSMNSLSITINGHVFRHILYHFILTYSNWETFTICFSESFESLQKGLQEALWELGGVPLAHRTDRLTAAVSNTTNPAEFTRRYTALMDHYGLEAQKIQAGKANENGDIEQRHYRFKDLVDQALMLRGSRDFNSREEYASFLREVCNQANAGRSDRFAEELQALGRLPVRKIDDFTVLTVSVTRNSTIRVKKNTYSIPSKLIGEKVVVHLYADYLEIRYGRRKLFTLPRLRGTGKHSINYRHVIDSLVRKPGAFANYRYHEDMFPSSMFRVAYDMLKKANPSSADRNYLKILELAAKDSQVAVAEGIRILLNKASALNFEALEAMVSSHQSPDEPIRQVTVESVNLTEYDQLIKNKEVL